ncbi:MAG: FecR domain-containing protein, partial [Deltaproteobacteria bacterium]|nr:FecR domain-containing protein [Deltaproteobacteria bacterium]
MLAKPEKLYLEILFFIVGLVLGAWASVAQAQENSGATILKIAGKAEILSQGQRLPAHEGFRLSPGQSIQLVGGGEVRLSTNGGKVQVRVLADTTVKYDGEVDANGQPWGPSSKLREVSTGGSGQMAPQISVPVGKLEIQVEPGQELRVVCPLIMAAVRGTRFNISVELDGSSTVTTLEGRVATYGRNGELRLISSGQSAQVTARAYSNFLANQGVSVPRGSWREAPAQTQAAVDDRTLGNIFGP